MFDQILGTGSSLELFQHPLMFSLQQRAFLTKLPSVCAIGSNEENWSEKSLCPVIISDKTESSSRPLALLAAETLAWKTFHRSDTQKEKKEGTNKVEVSAVFEYALSVLILLVLISQYCQRNNDHRHCRRRTVGGTVSSRDPHSLSP